MRVDCQRRIFLWKQILGYGYLKPINGTTVDKWRKLSESVSEGITNRTHSQNDMQLVSDAINKVIEQSHRRAVCLLGLVTLPLRKNVLSVSMKRFLLVSVVAWKCYYTTVSYRIHVPQLAAFGDFIWPSECVSNRRYAIHLLRYCIGILMNPKLIFK